MSQGSLFSFDPSESPYETPRARRTDPETSHIAADAVEERLSYLRQWLYDALLESAHGLTQGEAFKQYREEHPSGSRASSTITGRFKELETLGWARRTETRRMTENNRPAQVWEAIR